MRKVSRRDFLKFAALSVSYFGSTQIPMLLAQDRDHPVHIYHGTNLEGWELALGDARFEAPSEPTISLHDISTIHRRPNSILQANVQRRRIMAHNITFKRFFAANAMGFIHKCHLQFRLPYIPSTSNGNSNSETRNAETFDIGVFVWDGANTKIDYGMAFSWLLNPWTPNFGNVRQWNGTGWTDGDYLAVDTRWHTAQLTVNFQQEITELIIDGHQFLSQFTHTIKPDFEGDTRTAARLQTEAISLFPGSNNGALHEMEVKNWNWRWEAI
jgi:hypothetical protein